MHRDPPICRDCKHCWARPLDPMCILHDWHNAVCRASEVPADPVSGRARGLCRNERAGSIATGHCGETGTRFEPKFSLWRWLSNLWRIEA